MNLLGFSFQRIKPQIDVNPVANAALSFVEKNTDSTAAVISASASYGTYVDLQGTIKTEAELITKYRDMLVQFEVDNAVDEIVNEAISTDEDFVVKIDLDDLPFDENAKQMIADEFETVLKLLDFKFHAYNIFKRWYVDGRLYYNIIIDNDHPDLGIQELRYVDPRKIREIHEVEQKKLASGMNNYGSIEVQVTKNEYYLYNEKGFGGTNKTSPSLQGSSSGGIRIAKDTIIHVPSGLTDVNGNMGIGFLHKAIKILNQLRTIEDSLIIYRLARAPERRVWYIDVGDMPRIKADQYVRDIMVNQRNRLIYDANSGEIRDDRKFLTMTDDYFLPKRSDGSGTRVDELKGGQTLGQIDDIVYFQKQLYGCLNVPVGRLSSENAFIMPNATQEVSREEIKFDKFITRLRQQFSLLFTGALERQIVLKGLMTIEEWEQLAKDIQFEFARDNPFAEMKDQQILTARLQTIGLIQPLIGLYYSHKWVRRNILKQTDEDIAQMTMEIAEEMQDPLYQQAAMAAQENDGESEEGGQENQGGNEDNEQSDQAADPDSKVDQAKHVVQALKDVKRKTPGDIKKLRSAAEILAKNK